MNHKSIDPGPPSRDSTFENLQDMFQGNVDPEVIHMVLTECDWNVEQAVELLVNMSSAATETRPSRSTSSASPFRSIAQSLHTAAGTSQILQNSTEKQDNYHGEGYDFNIKDNSKGSDSIQGVCFVPSVPTWQGGKGSTLDALDRFSKHERDPPSFETVRTKKNPKSKLSKDGDHTASDQHEHFSQSGTNISKNKRIEKKAEVKDLDFGEIKDRAMGATFSWDKAKLDFHNSKCEISAPEFAIKRQNSKDDSYLDIKGPDLSQKRNNYSESYMLNHSQTLETLNLNSSSTRERDQYSSKNNNNSSSAPSNHFNELSNDSGNSTPNDGLMLHRHEDPHRLNSGQQRDLMNVGHELDATASVCVEASSLSSCDEHARSTERVCGEDNGDNVNGIPYTPHQVDKPPDRDGEKSSGLGHTVFNERTNKTSTSTITSALPSDKDIFQAPPAIVRVQPPGSSNQLEGCKNLENISSQASNDIKAKAGKTGLPEQVLGLQGFVPREQQPYKQPQQNSYSFSPFAQEFIPNAAPFYRPQNLKEHFGISSNSALPAAAFTVPRLKVTNTDFRFPGTSQFSGYQTKPYLSALPRGQGFYKGEGAHKQKMTSNGMDFAAMANKPAVPAEKTVSNFHKGNVANVQQNPGYAHVKRRLEGHLKQGKKILVILRGLSGSGKSTLAREVCFGGKIFSTDDYFLKNGAYDFKIEELGDAHSKNRQLAKEAMENGVNPVIIDNTNSMRWEMKGYVVLAQEYGYHVEILEPNTPWKFNANQLAKRNTHGVPKETIQKMLQRYDKNVTVESILGSKIPAKKAGKQKQCQKKNTGSAQGQDQGQDQGQGQKQEDMVSNPAEEAQTVQINSEQEVPTQTCETNDRGSNSQTKSITSDQNDTTNIPSGSEKERKSFEAVVNAELEENWSEESLVFATGHEQSRIAVKDNPDHCGLGSSSQHVTSNGPVCPMATVTEANKQREGLPEEQTPKTSLTLDGADSDIDQELEEYLIAEAASAEVPENHHEEMDVSRAGIASECIAAIPSADSSTSEPSIESTYWSTAASEQHSAYELGIQNPETVVQPGVILGNQGCVDWNVPKTRREKLEKQKALKEPQKSDSRSSNDDRNVLEQGICESVLNDKHFDVQTSVSSSAQSKDNPVSSSPSSPRTQKPKRMPSKKRLAARLNAPKLDSNTKQQLLQGSWVLPNFDTSQVSTDMQLLPGLQKLQLSPEATQLRRTRAEPQCNMRSTESQTTPQDMALVQRINSNSRNTVIGDDVCVIQGVPRVITVSESDSGSSDSRESTPSRQLRLMLHKSCMTEDEDGEEIGEGWDEKEKANLANLQALFPTVPPEDLRDLLEKCNQNLSWAVNILLDTNRESLNVSPGVSHPSPLPPGIPKLPSLAEMCSGYLDFKPAAEPSADHIAIVSTTSQEEIKAKVNHSKPLGGVSTQDRLGQGFPPLGAVSEEDGNEKALVCYDSDSSHSESEESLVAEEDSGLVLKLPKSFARKLEEMFGAVGEKIADTSADLKVSLSYEVAKSLHKCWLKTLQREMWRETQDIARMEKEDEELARQLQEAENSKQRTLSLNPDWLSFPLDVSTNGRVAAKENSHFNSLDASQKKKKSRKSQSQRRKMKANTPPAQLRDIMSQQMALQVEREGLFSEDGSSNSIATKIKRQQLAEMFPQIDEKPLDELFAANNYELGPTVEVVKEIQGRTAPPKDVVSPEALAEYERLLIEKAQQESLEDQRHLVSQQSSDFQDYDTPEYQDFRAEADMHFTQRQECFQKAQEAHNRGMHQVAVYYSQQGHLHTQYLKEANRRASEKILEYKNAELQDNVLDLHGLHVPEALDILERVMLTREAEL